MYAQPQLVRIKLVEKTFSGFPQLVFFASLSPLVNGEADF
jgi:hypothetical protein